MTRSVAFAKATESPPDHINASLLNAESDSELEVAFEQFTSLSAKLTESYQQLEQRVSHLTDELNRSSDKHQQALQDKNDIADRFENLLDFLPGGVVVLDARGNVSQVNPVAEELLGKCLMGVSWRSIIASSFAPRSDDGHEVSTLSGRKISISTRSLQNHGQIILLTDLTETRQLQAKISREERLSSMGKMVSALAHQIRTPLSAALLYAGHLDSQMLDDEQRRSFAKKLLSRLHHMEQQVRDMLLFVKGDLNLNDQVNLGGLLQLLHEAAEPVLQQHFATADWGLVGAKKWIKCNRDVLVSALMNLINNAIQAGGHRVHLDITIAASAGDCVISVIDNGPGVSQEVLEKDCETFVTTKPQGIGLGLTVVKAVAQAHGGTFSLNNGDKGGAVATVTVPLLNPSK
ncbi:sensor histidine kinase [Aurantivibrio plasticivorans]